MPSLDRFAAPTLVVALMALGACGGAPAPAPNAPHTHQHTTMVTVTDAALLPSPTVRIPILSTVVWRNRSQAPLRVEVDSASCGGCDTVMGFTPGTTGARAADVAPGAVATLCFHRLGSFPFVARTGTNELRGTIEVGEAK